MKVMLCPARSGPHLNLLQKHLKEEGIKVHQISWFGKQSAFSMLELIMLRAAGYKILNLNWMPFNHFWQLRMVKRTCDAFGIRIVWTIHNLAPHEQQFSSREEDIEAMKFMAEWAKAGVVHSERTASDFKSKYGDRLPITVIPLANYSEVIDLSDPFTSRKKLGFPDDKIMVLMLGPSRWNKGIRGFLRVLESLPENYIGVLVGGCKDNGIRALIDEHKQKYPKRYIVRLEHLSDRESADYFAACDVFFMPFEEITTSGSVMDALSHGKAIVTTDLGNLDMLVKNDVNGYLVHTDEEAISCLKAIDRSTAFKMGEKSFEMAKLFVWGDTARSYINVYQSILK